MAGHALAGAAAVASTVSFVLYHRSGRRVDDGRRLSLLVTPRQGGWLFGCSLRR